MKTIGFISEHENNILNSKYCKSFNHHNFSKLYSNKKEILNYLKKGESIGSRMEIIRSLYPNDSEIIGGVIYLTDGVYVWPNYLIYYFEKYNIEIEEDFIKRINNRPEIKLNRNEIREVLLEFKTIMD